MPSATADPTTAMTGLRGWLSELAAEHGGRLTAEIVREAARPAESPAHAFVFGLSEHEAAEAHYLEQAYKLIRYATFEVIVAPKEPPRMVRFWHQVTTDGERVYLPYTELIKRPDLFEQAKAEALRRVRAAEDSLGDLDLLAKTDPQATATATALGHVRAARQALTDVPAEPDPGA